MKQRLKICFVICCGDVLGKKRNATNDKIVTEGKVQTSKGMSQQHMGLETRQ